MSPTQISYLVFGIVLLLAVILDLGLLSRRSATISLRKALIQTVFWVLLALAFGIFVWYEKGRTEAIEYVSAYMMEWSLSIDNIFVFILIFGFFKIKENHEARALLIGILMAIVFRIIFISAGVILVDRFSWILYIFGAFLVYTGIKIFSVKQDHVEFDPASNPVYKFLNRFLPVVHDDEGGKFIIRKDGKRFFTNMFVIVILLATTDIVFALDSIPAVFAIVASKEEMIIYTSNIFAVLGLRSLFFLLKGAVNKFEYLQQGIAVVLIFIGLKMLAEIFHFKVPAYISLIVIIICLAGSIVYSVQTAKNENGKTP
ncbi:MAG: tellurium resistance protein TerC [Chitinophagaceae bacterium]|nr:tellurium resistance protein TerC [Chitinophagaceae bacterium]